MSKPPPSENSAPPSKAAGLKRQNLPLTEHFDPELWKRAQAEQDAEEQAKASPVPVVFPVHE
jgi:hypothetical protein